MVTQEEYNQQVAQYEARRQVYEWAQRGQENLIAGWMRYGTSVQSQVAGEYLTGVWGRGRALTTYLKKQAETPPPTPPTQIKPPTYFGGGIGLTPSGPISMAEPSSPLRPSPKPPTNVQVGTYNVGTGVYTAPSGERYSTATPPSSAIRVSTITAEKRSIELQRQQFQQSSEQIQLTQKQVDTYRYKGRDIPIYRIVATEGGVERPATKEEEKYYKRQTNVLRASTEKPTIVERAKQKTIFQLDLADIGFERVGKGAEFIDLKIESTGVRQTEFYKDLSGQSLYEAGVRGYQPVAIGIPSTFATTKLLFAGTQKGATTRVVFMTSTGKKGVAVSGSRVVGTTSKGARIIETKTYGAFSRTSIKFPTGKITTQLEKPFLAKEFSVVGSRGEILYQYGGGKVGAIAKLPKSQEFVGFGFGTTTRAGSTLSVSRTLTAKGGDILSAGILRSVPSTTKGVSSVRVVGGMGPSSTLSSSTLKTTLASVSQASISQAIAGASVSTVSTAQYTPVAVLSTTRVQRVQKVSQQIKSVSYTPSVSEQKISVIQKGTQKVTPRQDQKTRQFYGTGTIQIPRITTSTVQAMAIAPVQKARVSQIQKIPLLTKKIVTTPRIIVSRGITFFGGPTPKLRAPSSLRIAPRGYYSVSVRRFGKFRTIGTGLTLQRAYTLGRLRTSRTLGATFKIAGKGSLSVPTPSGYYIKYEKGQKLFIEKPKFRLSTTPEKQEIKIFRMKKGVKI